MMVGAKGFEPSTLWSQTRCATRLRYTPTDAILPCGAVLLAEREWVVPTMSPNGGARLLYRAAGRPGDLQICSSQRSIVICFNTEVLPMTNQTNSSDGIPAVDPNRPSPSTVLTEGAHVDGVSAEEAPEVGGRTRPGTEGTRNIERESSPARTRGAADV